MVAAAYREIIGHWVRQRRERHVIEAEREVAYRRAREAAARRRT
jgi:hypothetical protein